MISVIICSVNKKFAAQVKQNIDETIGVPWEAIIIDNTELKRGITYVYNLGAAKATYDILCFVHEDVLFQTQAWGKIIEQWFLNDERLGLIGIAGSKFKSRTMSGWSTGSTALDCCNILHISPQQVETRIYSNPDPGKKLQEVITIDGVLMIARRHVWEAVRFNEKLIDGFHLYDIDFSFRTAQQFKVAVVFDIDLVHLTTGGDFGDKWIKYNLLWHKAYAHQLPVAVKNEVPFNQLRAERLIRKNWLHRLKREKITFSNRVRWIIAAGHYFHIFSWPYVVLFFVRRPLDCLAGFFKK